MKEPNKYIIWRMNLDRGGAWTKTLWTGVPPKPVSYAEARRVIAIARCQWPTEKYKIVRVGATPVAQPRNEETMPKKTQVRTREQKRREDVWIVQLKFEGDWEISSSCSSAYRSRKEARQAIARLDDPSFPYRAVRYSPATD